METKVGSEKIFKELCREFLMAIVNEFRLSSRDENWVPEIACSKFNLPITWNVATILLLEQNEIVIIRCWHFPNFLFAPSSFYVGDCFGESYFPILIDNLNTFFLACTW